jgi:hypothetical protein
VSLAPRFVGWAGLLVCAAAPAALVYGGVWPPPAALISICAFVAAAFWALRDRIHGVMLVFLVALLAATVALLPGIKVFSDRPSTDDHEQLSAAWRASGPFDERLPIVVHMVFDELTAPGAIDQSLASGPATREALVGLGNRHGLRTSDAVYSRYFFSAVALPNLLHDEFLGRSRTANVTTAQRTSIRDNAYFDAMAARGYRTVVFQTSHLDFCANARVAHCETFNSFDPGSRSERVDDRSQTLHLWRTLLRAYEPSFISEYGTAALARAYGLGDRAVGVLGTEGRFDVQRFPGWFDRFTRFAANVPRGTHVFAHFMAPHAPYLLTPDCVVSGRFAAGYYLQTVVPDPETRELERRRYAEDYLAQVRCVASELDAFLSAIDDAPAFHDARIVVHGDHGSRISAGNVLEDYEPRDFVANYGTYFAVKAPGIEPGLDCEQVSLPEAFRDAIDADDGQPAFEVTPLPVVVDSRAAGGRKVTAPMPPFGCGAAR